MERATFLPDDPPCLVEASLACPICLHTCDWRVSESDGAPAAHCRCRACAHERTVLLTGPQLLRLTLPDDDDDRLITGPGLEAAWRAMFWDD
jgi:hypothetical protein